MTTLASSVAAKLDIKLGDVSTIATDTTTKEGNQIKGAYHEGSNDIVINDVNTKNTGDAVNTLGHEIAHALDSQDGVVRKGMTADGQSYSEEYANTMGESLQDYADFAMWNNTEGQTLANTNHHNGTVDKTTGNTIATTGTATRNFVERRDNEELDYRQVVSIRGGDPSKATELSVDSKSLELKGQNLEKYKEHYVNFVNDKLSKALIELNAKGYSEKDKNIILEKYKEDLIANISSEEFDTTLVSLPIKVKEIDPETKVKFFDSGQSQTIVNSIVKDYEEGEQIILQGHSAGGGDVQDVAEALKDKGIDNVITVQVDSIEPLGDDASIPNNVTKAVNVYQKESKTGNTIVDFIDSDAMNGENNIHRAWFNDKTEIVNKEFKNIAGPSQGSVNSSHRNIDNDHRVQKFIQEQVLPEVKKDMEKQNETNY